MKPEHIEQQSVELFHAYRIAQEAGIIAKALYAIHLPVENKSNDTPVTIADKACSKFIMESLREVYPQHGIVSEEDETINEGADSTWYIDPIDGTSGFIKKTGQFAIHIGLAQGGKPKLGVVYNPLKNKLYFGHTNHGSFVDVGDAYVPLKVSETNEIIPVISHNDPDSEIERNYKGLDVKKVERTGSMGLRYMKLVDKIATVTLGNFQGKGGTWDICAPQAILEAAGGVVRKSNLERMTYIGQRELPGVIIAANNMSVLQRVAANHS
ncbi:MAG: 3'(2'), 5'-bisphosphate nucleotidase [Candidatus Woesearchaeota archaeon]|jgi:3'(2'), 5'-bisphosphate nucleotidase